MRFITYYYCIVNNNDSFERNEIPLICTQIHIFLYIEVLTGEKLSLSSPHLSPKRSPRSPPKVHHSQSDPFILKPAQIRDVHSSAVSDDGTVLHEEEFKVHTGWV